MIEGRIIGRKKRLPNGHNAKWFEIETVQNGLRHRRSVHTYPTEDEARLAAAVQCDLVDSALYQENL